MPFLMAFEDIEQNSPWFFTELVIDFLFMLDILVNFNSAYYDTNGNLVKDRKTIVISYIRTWFLIDFVASFPFDFIESDDS